MLRTRVLSIVREDIISGRFQPGERINEVEVAAAIGVSRGTLREALRNLEQEGLLVAVPHRGTFMRTLSPEEANDLSEVRLSLEVTAATRIARDLTEDKLALLEERFAALDHASRSVLPFPDRLRADLAFHESICIAAGNTALLRTWRSIIGSITAMVINVGEEPMKSLQDPEPHRELLAAILGRDESNIRSTFARHFEAGQRVVAATLAARSLDGASNSLGPGRDSRRRN
jgi:DNA-binding GntR family transcriptional regulator